MKNSGLSEQELEQIRAVLRAVPAIEKAVLFGSRAMGLARGNSDVDIMLYGDALTMGDVARARALLEETTLPYQFDLVLYDAENAALQEHVRQYGKVVISKSLNSQIDGWRKCTLGEFVALQRGHDLPDRERKVGTVPILGSFGITGYHDTAKMQGPGVTLGRSGASFGVTAYTNFDYWPLNTALYVTDFKGNNPYFTYCLFQSLDFSGFNSGSAQPSLNRNNIYPLDIVVPCRNEQNAIGSIFRVLDNRIQLLREANATLEAMAQALFKSWFVDLDPVHAKAKGRTPEGMDAETAALFPSEFEDSELGIIPKGWKVAPIGEHVTIVGGGTPSTKNPDYWAPEEHAWTSPKDLSGLSSPVLLSTEKKISSAGLAVVSSGLLPEGTLLLSSRAPIGYLAIAKIPLAINQGYIAVTPESELPPIFMYFWCKLNMEIIKGHANGSTFMEISKKAFRLIPSIIPDRSVVSACLSILQVLFGRITSNEEQARTLTTLRDALLPRLISGKLRLPEFAASTNEAEI